MISVIMAAYNAEKTISYAIESVLNQSFPDLEMIVVNDCSTDNTATIISKYQSQDKRIKLINNETNKGVSCSRYEALKNSKGYWIAIIDSDDIWDASKLEKQLAVAKRRNARLIFTGSAFINQEGKRLTGYLPAPRAVGYRNLLKQNIISNSSVLIEKKLYEDNYVFGDNMHEDFAIWLSILKTGEKAYGINRPLLIYRLSNSSKSSNKIKAAIMNWNTYRYVGLNIIQAFLFECCYMYNGLRKYSKIKR